MTEVVHDAQRSLVTEVDAAAVEGGATSTNRVAVRDLPADLAAERWCDAERYPERRQNRVAARAPASDDGGRAYSGSSA
jgi:hypothetical protein